MRREIEGVARVPTLQKRARTHAIYRRRYYVDVATSFQASVVIVAGGRAVIPSRCIPFVERARSRTVAAPPRRRGPSADRPRRGHAATRPLNIHVLAAAVPRPIHERSRRIPPRSAASSPSSCCSWAGSSCTTSRRSCSPTGRSRPRSRRERGRAFAARTFADGSRRRRGCGSSGETSRGDAAAATRIVRGDESRRRRGRDVEIRSRPARASGTGRRPRAATWRCRTGADVVVGMLCNLSCEYALVDAAAATPVAATPRRQREYSCSPY